MESRYISAMCVGHVVGLITGILDVNLYSMGLINLRNRAKTQDLINVHIGKRTKTLKNWNGIGSNILRLSNTSQLHTEKHGLRASHDIGENRFYECDVCWTCEFYDVELHGCDEFYLFDGNPRCRQKFVREIKKPDWYRCSHWKEKE